MCVLLNQCVNVIHSGLIVLGFALVTAGFHASNVLEITTNANQLLTQPLTSASQLLASASLPLMSASLPLTSSSQPLTSTSQPLTLTSQPLASASQPLTSASKPLTLTSQPLTSTSQPLTSTSQPLTSPPLTSTSQPIMSTSQPLTSASQPLTSASQSLTSMSQPLTTTNQPPFTLTSEPLTSRSQDSSFEFGEFQGSSIEQPVDITTGDNNWASFESAFKSNESDLVQNTTTQEAFTATTTSVNAYTSAPSQFATFDEVNFPPTSTSQPVSNDTGANHPEDKYSAFDVVRVNDPIPSTTGNEDSEFGQFEMGQPPPNTPVKVEHYSTQVRPYP